MTNEDCRRDLYNTLALASVGIRGTGERLLGAFHEPGVLSAEEKAIVTRAVDLLTDGKGELEKLAAMLEHKANSEGKESDVL